MALTEDDWQGQVVDIAKRHRWRIMHLPQFMFRRRGALMIPGWPDLVLIKGTRVVFAELKAARGVVSPEQRAVLTALAASGNEVALWRPADLADVMAVLGRAGQRATLPHDFPPLTDRKEPARVG